MKITDDVLDTAMDAFHDVYGSVYNNERDAMRNVLEAVAPMLQRDNLVKLLQQQVDDLIALSEIRGHREAAMSRLGMVTPNTTRPND